MLNELYEIITSVYENMNQKFEIPLSDITEDTELDTLGIDSLTFVMIMLAIENYYKIDMASDTDICYTTISDVIRVIKSKLG